MHKGCFITVEGGEGAGKTTVLDRIETTLKNKGFSVLRTREPGGIRISEQIRAIILNVNHTEMDSRTEALLYAAARRQHLVEKIIPALREGYIVLCDRFIDSSLVYQGFARELGLDAVKAINDFAIDGHMPDLTLYFDVNPNIGLKRIRENDERELNRLDLETMQFHELVRKGYHLVYQKNKRRIKWIDANKEFDDVYHEALNQIIMFLSSRH
ncbi:dTMP kinase [bacterium LRH843]|nr:dTMP kinase [bacterium LRH843]